MPKHIPELDKLFFEVDVYRNSKNYMEMLDFIKKFRHIAPYNAMLVYMQKPGSVFVATAREWKENYNRDIKPGARPLVILRNFGPVTYVYELMDTVGQDLPETFMKPFEASGNIDETTIYRLIQNMLCEGIATTPREYGSWMAGGVTICDRTALYFGNIYIRILFDIVYNQAYSPETIFATLLHELGHIYCGHVKNPKAKWIVTRDRYYPSLNEREFEAESVCWLICERMGVKNPSAEYLSDYVNSCKEIPDISVDAVLKAVGVIETMVKDYKMPRKEIVIKGAS